MKKTVVIVAIIVALVAVGVAYAASRTLSPEDTAPGTYYIDDVVVAGDSRRALCIVYESPAGDSELSCKWYRVG